MDEGEGEEPQGPPQLLLSHSVYLTSPALTSSAVNGNTEVHRPVTLEIRLCVSQLYHRLEVPVSNWGLNKSIYHAGIYQGG